MRRYGEGGGRQKRELEQAARRQRAKDGQGKMAEVVYSYQ